MSKLSGEFKAVWNGIQLILSEKEYDIAMSHVEHIRQVAADKKYYRDPEVGEEDEDYIEPDESDEWVFRAKPATDSDRSRPLIPIDSGHPFRRKAATPS